MSNRQSKEQKRKARLTERATRERARAAQRSDAEVESFIETNLTDLVTLGDHLDRFEDIRKEIPELRQIGLDPDEVEDVLAPFLAAPLPAGWGALELVGAVVDELVDTRCTDEALRMISRVLRDYDLSEDDEFTLMAVGALVEARRGAAAAGPNPFWFVIAREAIEFFINTGNLLTRLARPAVAEIDGAPKLHMDALLNLAHANARFVFEHGRAFLESGRSDAMVEAARATLAAAFERDFTSEVGDRVRVICESQVRAAQDRGDVSGAAEAIAWLQRLSRNDSLLDIYAVCFERLLDGDDPEQPFVVRIVCGGATDRWALEEYEKLLRAGSEPARAARVRRFLDRDCSE